MKDEKENERCKKCGSLQTYIKLKAKERVCRFCGNIEKLKIDRKIEKWKKK